jgi:RHH-type transcriptional regulator, proline utilization regulon repressor / proline dehydrogenase / delta 1-pyrroline-5-carboxylate dehydrogenase
MERFTEWDDLDRLKFADERRMVGDLLAAAPLDGAARDAVHADAAKLVTQARQSPKREGVVEGFLKEFSLGTREGLALMCLAEALLRTPDAATRDLLIAEKLGPADWASHLGHSDSLLINASTWGLMLTGKLIQIDAETGRDLGAVIKRMMARASEPIIRNAVMAAMRIMAEQFVVGRTIDEALSRAEHEGLTCSFDMLGEGARSETDALRHMVKYAEAIAAVGARAAGMGPERGHGISVKLSALCPQYEAVQEERVFRELYPRLLDLARQAARHNINLAIDAEEADRLVLSLKLIDRLAHERALGDWQGLGVVVQAYQKRGLAVIAGLADLAQRSGRRMMVRLVKGAYWDSEIKQAQVLGMPEYPVFTTKAATDVAYLACAKALIAASPALFPQFATHNAHTLAAVRHMAAGASAGAGVSIEHQRLQGMGEALYAAATAHYDPLRIRTYAPVGGHDDLLPYLVRRLLENGANSSFVHALLDENVPVAQVVADPMATLAAWPERHARIALPCAIYADGRRNPQGRDWTQSVVRAAADAAVVACMAGNLSAGPIVGGVMLAGEARDVVSPADASRKIGEVVDAAPDHVELAAAKAAVAQGAWDRAGGDARADVLDKMADALVVNGDELIALLGLEGGKTRPDAIAELREAVDFCRYYAGLARAQFGTARVLQGPVGEVNSWGLMGRGVFACISPWNFPLAIFTGQIAAALAAGNAVIAKPAEQTPLIAAAAVRLFHAAGLDADLLALLPGDGAVIGAALVAHPLIAGVAFTGGTDTAWAINRAIAGRDGPIIPFIAETGGLNAMFVDTTALTEQVVDDVMTSAFGSAGQRCSALRMVFLPVERADDMIAGLVGALAVRVVGDPVDCASDIGPVIDAEAVAALNAHVARLEREAVIVARHEGAGAEGHYFAPVIAEVREPDFLEREVFGPILHICRYRPEQLDDYARRLAARGYGLTLGIHSRLDSFAQRISALVPAGNIYVNRAMTGAVVGVQPFGGLGLSGTGPKAGGPHALLRFCHERSVSVNIMAQGGDPALIGL